MLNKRALLTPVHMLVEDIVNVPDSGSDWSAGDNVVFTGTLEQSLVFGAKKFDLSGSMVLEKYSLIADRNFKNQANYPITPIPLLGVVHVSQTEVDLVGIVTDGYRYDLSTTVNVVLEEVATTTNHTYVVCTRAELLGYLLQIKDGDSSRIYDLYTFSIFDSNKDDLVGLTFNNLTGPSGPVEAIPAQGVLINAMANAKILI